MAEKLSIENGIQNNPNNDNSENSYLSVACQSLRNIFSIKSVSSFYKSVKDHCSSTSVARYNGEHATNITPIQTYNHSNVNTDQSLRYTLVIKKTCETQSGIEIEDSQRMEFGSKESALNYVSSGIPDGCEWYIIEPNSQHNIRRDSELLSLE